VTRFWRNAAARLLLASAISLGIFAFAMIAMFMRPYMVTTSALLMDRADVVSDADRAACAADPATFTDAFGRGYRVWAYREDLASSANPEAPALPTRVQTVLPLEDRNSGAAYLFAEEHGFGGVTSLRGEPDTDCAWFVVFWPIDLEARAYMRRWAWTTATFGVFGALVVFSLAAILPLYRRIHALSVAAGNVGTEAWSRPDVEADVFGRVADVLEASHERVVAEREADAAARRALEEHLAAVAHDLRTPLAAVQLSLDEIRRRHEDGGDASDALRAAEEDVVYLAMLTENLRLATSLADGAKPRQQPFRLDEVTHRVARRFERLGARRGVEVVDASGDVAVWVEGDEVLAEQAIANLVHNAVSHHDLQGHVAVILEREGEGFRLEFSDDGPGVDASRIPEIDPGTWNLAGARSRVGRHSGLGLAIVAASCAQLGWSLALQDGHPRGAVFVIRAG
jgi:signal transduction histidine kinase